MKFTKFAILSLAFAAMLVGTQRDAKAIIFFNTEIDINLGDLALGGVVDVNDVGRLDFDGRVAINTTFDQNGAITGVRVVGGAVNDGGQQEGGNQFPGNAGLEGTVGQTTAFEVTTVIRDWNGASVDIDATDLTDVTITTTYASGVRTDGGDENTFPVSGTGLIDLYLDTSPDYNQFDAETSSDGVWIGTFAITQVQANTPGVEPYTEFRYDSTLSILNGGGETRVGLELIAAPTDTLWSSADGDALLGTNLGLLTLISSSEVAAPNDPAFTNIFGGAGDPVDIGAGFNPATAVSGAGFPNDFPFDNVSTFDSNNTFAIIPEPSSFVMLGIGGALLAGVGIRRRRNAKKAA